MPKLTPASNAHIAQKYDAKSLDKKVKNKTDLQKDIGWPMEPKRAVLCLPLGMTDTLGGELFEELLPGLLSLPIEILVLGKGSEKYGKLFTKLSNEKKHRLHIVPNDRNEIYRMVAAADMSLFLADPTEDDATLRECLRYGAVPILPAGSPVEEYDPIQESGHSFMFEDASAWNCFAAIVRALESYRFPYDWRSIQKEGMAHG